MIKFNEMTEMTKFCDQLSEEYIRKFLENMTKNDNNFVGLSLEHDPFDNLPTVKLHFFNLPSMVVYRDLQTFLNFAKGFARQFYTKLVLVVMRQRKIINYVGLIDPNNKFNWGDGADLQGFFPQLKGLVDQDTLPGFIPAISFLTKPFFDSHGTIDPQMISGLPYSKACPMFMAGFTEMQKQVQDRLLNELLSEDQSDI
jgi:hypothetical protein